MECYVRWDGISITTNPRNLKTEDSTTLSIGTPADIIVAANIPDHLIPVLTVSGEIDRSNFVSFLRNHEFEINLACGGLHAI